MTKRSTGLPRHTNRPHNFSCPKNTADNKLNNCHNFLASPHSLNNWSGKSNHHEAQCIEFYPERPRSFCKISCKISTYTVLSLYLTRKTAHLTLSHRCSGQTRRARECLLGTNRAPTMFKNCWRGSQPSLLVTIN